MAGTNSVEYCSLNDIEDKCPEVKEMWLRNERYRQLAAKRTGVSIRMTINGSTPDLRAGYVQELFDLIKIGKIQPRHLKYLTGISHAGYVMRRRRLGIKPDKRYKDVNRQIHKYNEHNKRGLQDTVGECRDKARKEKIRSYYKKKNKQKQS